MFSIIIPLFNKAKYITKTIESVLKQSYQEYELIVINDGSTDNSMEIVKSINDPRIVLIDQKNQGVSSTRNNGVKIAKNKFIAFLDADDWWHERFLTQMKKLIDNFPEAGLYGCNYFYVKDGKYRLDYKGLDKDFPSGYIDYFKIYSESFCVPFNCSFVIVKKSVFEETGGFRSDLKYGEDVELWIRIALKYKIAYLNKPLAYSNQDVNSEDRALGLKLYDKYSNYIFNLDFLKEAEYQDSYLNKLLDGLRVRALLRYHINNYYPNELKNILAEVDFTKQSLQYRLYYKMPRALVKIYFRLKKLASSFKQYTLKFYKKIPLAKNTV